MKRTAIRWLAAAFLMTACERDTANDRAGSVSRKETAVASSARTVSAGGAPCVLSPLWSPCLVRKALDNAGLGPIEEDSVHHPFLGVAGRRWKLGRAELQTFLYPSAAALQHDLVTFDTVTSQPRTGPRVAWAGAPSAIVSRNLLAVFIGGSERQNERIHLVLEAGILGVRSR